MINVTPNDGVLRVLNWKPSRPSPARAKLSLKLLAEATLPTSMDLSNTFPDPFDQGQIGSCVDNATCGLYAHQLLMMDYKWKFIPSRLFSYYNARDLEGNASSDAGSTVADGILAMNKYGVCPEQELDGTSPNWIWPYDTNQFATKPPQQCYDDAILHEVVKDQSVSLDRATVLNALAAGRPFCFGFTVNESFMTQAMADNGIMHVADPNDPSDPEVGGHGVDAIGYVLGKPMGDQGVVDWVLVRNSWGLSWGCAAATGVRGHFYMPLDQVLCNPDIASDAHAITLTTEAA
jgi:C1A family cysteine protease